MLFHKSVDCGFWGYFLGFHMKGKDKESNLNFPNHKAMHLS